MSASRCSSRPWREMRPRRARLADCQAAGAMPVAARIQVVGGRESGDGEAVGSKAATRTTPTPGRQIRICPSVGASSFNLTSQRAAFRRVGTTAVHPTESGVVLALILPIAPHYAFIPRPGRLYRWIVVPPRLRTYLPELYRFLDNNISRVGGDWLRRPQPVAAGRHRHRPGRASVAAPIRHPRPRPVAGRLAGAVLVSSAPYDVLVPDDLYLPVRDPDPRLCRAMWRFSVQEQQRPLVAQ
jgi:hypothetical protein